MIKGSGRLRGAVALVTGASSGIGYAIAKLFGEEGASVAAVSRRSEGMERWRDVANILPIQADITECRGIARMVAVAERDLGPIDVVCNVAGINDLCYPLCDTSDELWEKVLTLDLKAPFQICREVVPGMVRRGRGTILNIASYAATRGNHGASYSAAKHGLIGLTLSIAVAYGRKGIRCNAINPGSVVNTGISAGSGGEYHPEGYRMFLDIAQKLPVKWMCDAEDIAPTAVFLCSEEAKHVNGAVIAVDGGMSAC